MQQYYETMNELLTLLVDARYCMCTKRKIVKANDLAQQDARYKQVPSEVQHDKYQLVGYVEVATSLIRELVLYL